uniref:Secreted protein n=1 Tax=Trichogramma kaykai TaxID=54128 RepID=A0ABD2WEB9_9HYME
MDFELPLSLAKCCFVVVTLHCGKRARVHADKASTTRWLVLVHLSVHLQRTKSKQEVMNKRHFERNCTMSTDNENILGVFSRKDHLTPSYEGERERDVTTQNFGHPEARQLGRACSV